MSKNDVSMRVPRRKNNVPGQLSTGPGAARGRVRTVDIDENDTYFPLSLKISSRMRHRLRLAVAASDMSQLEFIIRALEPAIGEVLTEHGIEG